MRRFRDASLQRKQTWVLVLSSTLALFLAGGAMVGYERWGLRSRIVKDLSMQAAIIGNNCAAALDFDDPKAATEILAGLRANPSIVFAVLYTPAARLFASYQRADVPSGFRPPAFEVEGERVENGRLTVFRRVVQNDETLGLLVLQHDLVPIGQSLKAYVGILGMVIVFSILLACLVSSRLQRLISLPILQVARAARTVAIEKNYAIRVPVGSRDELGALATDFNDMVSQIQARDTMLRQAQDELERRVRERTSDLAAANAALRLTQFAVDTAGDAVFWLKADASFIYVNEAACRLTGYSRQELLTRRAEDVNPAHPQEAWLSHWMELKQKKSLIFETRFRAKDGRFLPVEVAANYFTFAGEEYNCSFVRDITDRKRSEEERQHMQMELLHSRKMEAVGQLAAGIAHEINTPTQFVGDNTRFLEDAFGSILKLIGEYRRLQAVFKEKGCDPAMTAQVEAAAMAMDAEYLVQEIPEAIQQSLEGLQRISKIVRAMKDFSHPGSSEKEMTDINRAVETTVTVARNEWKYAADMELALDANLPPILCFAGEINQTLLILIVNAAHAVEATGVKDSGKKGTIRISTRRDGDKAEIRVSDTGTGIAEEHRSHIFEPFFTTKAVGRGTGQGLTMAYQTVVKKHGGTIQFETETGRGTTFVVRLPLGISPPSG
jgi:PAS domain S-box-containing protein